MEEDTWKSYDMRDEKAVDEVNVTAIYWLNAASEMAEPANLSSCH